VKITEFINNYRNEIFKAKDLTPGRASEILVECSALLGNINDLVRKTSMLYNETLAVKLKQCKSVAEAKVLSEITQEFSDMMRAKNSKEEVVDIIRSLKYFLRCKAEEFKEAY